MSTPTFCFFGTSEFSVLVLTELARLQYVPNLIITSPDRPQGRKLILTPPPVKEYALKHNIEILQPEKLDQMFIDTLKEKAPNGVWDTFILASYGKIIPDAVLNIPTHKTLNVHPSLLPRYRGASPIQSQILTGEENIGVSIMVMDEKMDHGPILTQATYSPNETPPHATTLHDTLARLGGSLLTESLPKYLDGTLTPTPQNHHEATFCKKITKQDGEIHLHDDPLENIRKIRAFEGWPGTYFFIEKNGKRVRVKILSAEIENGELVLKRVIPEGKKEMDYTTFLSS